MAQTIITCKDCGEKKPLRAKGLCGNCYLKHYRKTYKTATIKTTCPRCKKLRVCNHKGFCGACYNFHFGHGGNAESNIKSKYHITLKTYKRITEKCFICGFKECVDLHHKDKNHNNSDDNNLIGLCPNHHRMAHMFKHRKKIQALIKAKLLL